MLVEWLRSGVPLRWRGPAPEGNKDLGGQQDIETRKQLRDLVKDGVFIRGQARLVSPTFLIPKRDGSQRLIHDLRCLNKAIEPPSFTLHGARDAGQVTREANWLAVLDLRHGYQQVAMAEEARPFLGARLGSETVLARVLPFGLNLAPYVFTRLTGWLARVIRKEFGLQVAVYIDDFLLGGRTKEELEKGIDAVKCLFEELGVRISAEKEVQPAKEVEFLGFVWNSQKKTVAVPKERRREYRRGVMNLIRCPQSRATWRRVIGKLGFLRQAVGPAMRHIRSLLHVIAKRKGPKLLEASGEALEDLTWWAAKLQHPTEISLITKPVSASIATDASDTGLGYLINLSNTNNPERHISIRKGLVAQEPEAQINKKEILALLKALVEHKQTLQGRKVVWYCDSVTAVAAIRRQGTQRLSQGTWNTTKQVLDLLDQQDIKLLPRHVPGRLNGAADALSRLGGERSPWECAFEKVTSKYGPLQEDPCGATKEPTSLLEGLQWAKKRSLLWPRVDRIEETIEYLAMVVEERKGKGDPSLWERMAVLITPVWVGASWWGRLLALRSGFIHLGRLPTVDTRAWSVRNGHYPDWTASLCKLRDTSGPLQQ